MSDMIKHSRKTARRAVVTLACLAVLALMLILAGCGDGSSPSKPGNQQPNNGYSIISLFEQEVGNFLP